MSARCATRPTLVIVVWAAIVAIALATLRGVPDLTRLVAAQIERARTSSAACSA